MDDYLLCVKRFKKIYETLQSNNVSNASRKYMKPYNQIKEKQPHKNQC